MFHVEHEIEMKLIMVKQDVIDIIRDVKDFPKPGIIFKDITPIFQSPEAWNFVLNQFYERYKNAGITKIIGVEARGFLLGPALASKLNAGFVPVRKPGKLPWNTYSESYELEYGSDTIEMHKDALAPDDVVLIHDDLLATGGTIGAVVNLVNKFNVSIHEISFIIELSFLNGKQKIADKGIKSYSFISY